MRTHGRLTEDSLRAHYRKGREGKGTGMEVPRDSKSNLTFTYGRALRDLGLEQRR